MPPRLTSRFFALVLLTTLASGVGGCAGRGVLRGDGAAAAAIEARIDELWDALGDHDLDRFNGLCSDDWRLYTASGLRFSTDSLFKIHTAHMQDFQLVVSNLEVRVRDGVAWATYDAAMTGQFDGEPWGGRFLMTNLFERRSGRWVCVHMHESRMPDAD